MLSTITTAAAAVVFSGFFSSRICVWTMYVLGVMLGTWTGRSSIILCRIRQKSTVVTLVHLCSIPSNICTNVHNSVSRNDQMLSSINLTAG